MREEGVCPPPTKKKRNRKKILRNGKEVVDGSIKPFRNHLRGLYYTNGARGNRWKKLDRLLDAYNLLKERDKYPLTQQELLTQADKLLHEIRTKWNLAEAMDQRP